MRSPSTAAIVLQKGRDGIQLFAFTSHESSSAKANFLGKRYQIYEDDRVPNPAYGLDLGTSHLLSNVCLAARSFVAL